MEMQRTNIPTRTLKMNNKFGECVLPDFENYYKIVVLKMIV